MRPAPTGLDSEALLVALVLDPATYSRNRFFSLYKDAEARRVRRRAALVRSVVRQLAEAPVALDGLEVAASGFADVAYEVPSLGLRRTARLDALELALVRFALGRAGGRPAAGDEDTRRIEGVLARLADKLAPTTEPPPEIGNQLALKA
jgi:hypothetical protein